MKENKPKFGLIVFKNTDNIGDDVQSYAASRFLPSIDYIIDREQVDSFESDNKEIVNCIMNAWWLSKGLLFHLHHLLILYQFLCTLEIQNLMDPLI